MAVKKGREKEYKVPFYMLFSFADATDVFLMTLGSIGALGHGATIPVMTVLFGKMIQSFGGAQDPEDVLHRVSEVAIQYVYLAVGAGISSFLQVTCWIATGERQVARIRSLYLKAILKQEIAFFDKETTTGEVVERVSGDTVIIHDAMGERVGKFIQIMTASTGCIIVAFIKGWLLSLIMMSMIPLGMICGGLVSVFVSKMASKAQKAYSEAAVVVEQAIGSIKTVASFTGENRSVKEYDIALIKAYKSSIYEGIATGLGLGQGPPCTTAFAAGQAAAYNMFEAINRKPKIDAFDPKARVLPDIKGDIDFKNVYFRYPSREEQIFRGFSLSIKQGTTTALIGESGSGKSTVISLIERFYDPQAGDVLIDGEPILFASSIRDNVAYGKDNATIEEIQLATDSANASRFIDNMPQDLAVYLAVSCFGILLDNESPA
ncbi:hypothetical protein HPP92_011360 [Vanilla planifolia]|uniref:ABC transmembrane type-1 domain-containing protein n=1 Tax=Vanilla planifolia TaxID=51239 RepID=A0A835R0J5_VANPL|nr:hypothetical protein HPP92_011360 [Vanilla planifolia]